MTSHDCNPPALAALATPWLAQQCRMIQGVEGGLLAVWDVAANAFRTLARWPADAPVEHTLSSIAQTAWQQRQGIARDSGDHRHGLIACPLQLNERMFGVVALRVGQASAAQLPVVLQALQWATAWLSLSLHHARIADASRDARSLELLSGCLQADSFYNGAARLMDRLAELLGCDRVSLGWRRRSDIRLVAVSNMRRFDPRSDLALALTSAMREALAGGDPVSLSAQTPVSPTLSAHTELLRHGPPRTLHTLPLRDGGALVGAVTLEYAAEQSADSELFNRLPELLAPLSTLLALRERDDRGRTLRNLRALPGRLLGAREWGVKSAAIAALLALGVALLPVQYRITAPAELAGRTQRAIAAPQEGYIATATVRPGDRVRSGEVVATLDARELDLQRANWQAELDRYRKAYRNALAERDWAQSRIAGAQLAQAQAQLDLVETQLQRTKLHAPLDGIVVAGDLQQSLGAPVQRGQVLLEIAPLEGYRVILKVDERRIAGITAGQTGTLVLTASPATPLPVRIESVTPVAEVEDGHNRFKVEAQLLETPDWLRPGMSGVAKIAVADRPIGWIMTHDLIEWLRLSQWKLLP